MIVGAGCAGPSAAGGDVMVTRVHRLAGFARRTAAGGPYVMKKPGCEPGFSRSVDSLVQVTMAVTVSLTSEAASFTASTARPTTP